MPMEKSSVPVSQSGVEWENIWGKKTFLQRIVQWFRGRYTGVFMRILSKRLSKSVDFLEVGSGSGSFAIHVSSMVSRCVGIDNSPNSVALSKMNAVRAGSKAEFLLADCMRLPFRDNSFGIVWSQGFIQAIQDPGGCLLEQLRVCRNGGAVVATVPAVHSYLWLWHLVTRPRLLRFLWPWPGHRFYSEAELLSLGNSVSQAAEVKRSGFLGELLVLEIRK